MPKRMTRRAAVEIRAATRAAYLTILESGEYTPDDAEMWARQNTIDTYVGRGYDWGDVQEAMGIPGAGWVRGLRRSRS